MTNIGTLNTRLSSVVLAGRREAGDETSLIFFITIIMEFYGNSY